MCFNFNSLLILFLSVQISLQNYLQGSYHKSPIYDICPSKIYCHGELLDDIQMARLYADSKTFVDMQLLKNEAEIINAYKQLKNRNNGRVPDRAVLTQFINKYFSDDPLLEWVPPDFTDKPSIVDNISDPYYKRWILKINQIWKELARKVDSDTLINPHRHSYIYLPNGFFIAGGRFEELCYWGTYWILKGIMLCDMANTGRGILENFFYLVKTYGYVPNGNRVYYLMRSQPPLLIQMAFCYVSYTNDYDFIYKNIEYLETEFKFWMTNRTIEVKKNGKTYIMARYDTIYTNGPRPESYYEDKTLAQFLPTQKDKNELYSRIKSAAESGWEFSTKHLNNFGENTGNLTYTDPQNFIYVELNAILMSNAAILAHFFKLQKNLDKFNFYRNINGRFKSGIDALLWNDKLGIWLDYDLTKKSSRNYFYASNLTPLWIGSFPETTRQKYGKRVLEYLKTKNIIYEDGTPRFKCVPTSFYESSEQWDYPYCSPPLQAIVIQSLANSGYEPAEVAAKKLAESWIETNYAEYINNKAMFDKYSVTEKDSTSKSSKHVPETGFGWTNGLIFELFQKYGNTFVSPSSSK